MTEWWTYSLRDLLLFSPNTYYRLFELYNLDVWPLQLATLTMGIAVLLLLRHGGPSPSAARATNAATGRAIAVLLSLCWLWVAWAYHWQRYAHINWAASYFAIAFSLQALLLVWLGVARGRFNSPAVAGKQQLAGLGLIAFSLFCYPLLGLVLDRSWLRSEIFGITPDPTVMAMLGTLLLYRARPLWWLYPVPVIWSLVSGATLWAMGSPEFFILPLATLGLVCTAVMNSRTSRPKRI